MVSESQRKGAASGEPCLGELMRKTSWKRMKWGWLGVCICCGEGRGGSHIAGDADRLPRHPEEGQEGPAWPLEPGGQRRVRAEPRSGASLGASRLHGTPQVP